MRGRPVPPWVCGLPHFDQMTVGIADVATDLVLVVFRRAMELRVVSGKTNGKGKLSGATPEPRLVGPKSDPSMDTEFVLWDGSAHRAVGGPRPRL